MFVTYQPARVISSDEIVIPSKKTAVLGDEGLSARISFPAGIVICGMSQPDKTKGYITAEGEIVEISGQISIYNPSDSEKTVYMILSDTF